MCRQLAFANHTGILGWKAGSHGVGQRHCGSVGGRQAFTARGAVGASRKGEACQGQQEPAQHGTELSCVLARAAVASHVLLLLLPGLFL